jgi:hypothetical protein
LFLHSKRREYLATGTQGQNIITFFPTLRKISYRILMLLFTGSESFQLCGKGGQSHILRGSKGVGVTIESYGKVEISYINVDNF